MSKTEIIRYDATMAARWDEFARQSRNGTLLHQRGYMDYHSDCFTDCSLIALHDGRWRAILPACIEGDTLWSHRGLTYGGWLVPLKHFDATVMLQVMDAAIEWMRAQGIKRVEGAVVGDDSYYGFPYFDEDWDVGDLAYDYGAAVHALSFHDNLMNVSFTLDGRGRVSRSTITPPVPGVKVLSRCRGSKRNAVTPYLDYSVPALMLTGETTARTYRNTYANPTPAPMLVDSVERALLASEIRYDHDADVAGEVAVNRSLLVLHKSPELTEIITSLLDRSDNMFAHALLRAIGARDWETRGMNHMPADLDHVGVAAVKQWLQNQGIDTESLFMRDGSGLARANKAPVSFFGNMLSMMAHRRFDGVRLCDLMPKAAGRAGKTLKDNPLSDQIVLKSGSMRHVQCFVGYYPASEPRYAFAVLVNNFTCSQAGIREQIGCFLVDLFEDL